MNPQRVVSNRVSQFTEVAQLELGNHENQLNPENLGTWKCRSIFPETCLDCLGWEPGKTTGTYVTSDLCVDTIQYIMGIRHEGVVQVS